jgi:hypothetical protein
MWDEHEAFVLSVVCSLWSVHGSWLIQNNTGTEITKL